ncbi:MAG: histidine kinase [Lachnospiraceae bacterium]|nr:histidine kinase [Lachnospiraceae bacterium]
MKTLRDISLRVKVPVIFGVLLMFLVGLPCFMMYEYYYDTFSDTLDKTLRTAMNSNAGEVSDLIDSITVGIDVVNDNENAYITDGTGTMSSIGRFVLSEENPDEIGYLHQLQLQLVDNKTNFRGLFDAIFKTKSSELESALIIMQEYMVSKYLSVMHGDKIWSGSTFYSNKGLERHDWYRKALERDGEIYWFSVDYDQDKLYLAKLLKYQDYRNAGYAVRDLGVVLLGFDLSWIEERIDTNELTEETRIFLTDNTGSVLYTGGYGQEIPEKELTKLVSETVSGETVYRNYGGTRYIIQKNDIGQGLYMFTLIPVYDVQQMTSQMVKIILIVMLAIIVLGVLLVSVLSKYLLRPIIHLSEQMEKGKIESIENGYAGKDEIGLLYWGYNQMQKKIQELIQETWDSAERQKKVEIQALQAQINPHFILNTLSSIGCYALLNGQDQIASQLTKLSCVMHYNVRNPHAMVSLREEVDIIRKYEEIQKLNYSDNFRVQYMLSPACEDILVPKMIIQPLVENSIIHMRSAAGRGEITIVTRMQDAQTLVIIVADSGTGADIERINRYIRGECELDTAKDSFGVRNVYERIRLIFGEKGDLTYRTDREGYTEAVITIKVS